jgi:hypothetical protein
MRNMLAGATWVALACCFSACEDERGDPGTEVPAVTPCKPFVACGGDITGTWIAQHVCSDGIAAALGMVLDQPQCLDAIRSHMYRVSGDYTFAADGTASFAHATQLQVQLMWTSSCLTAINGGRPVNVPATCRNLSDKYQNDPHLESGSCLADGANCNCSVSG